MEFIFDNEKNKKLLEQRGISFEIALEIIAKLCYGVLKTIFSTRKFKYLLEESDEN